MDDRDHRQSVPGIAAVQRVRRAVLLVLGGILITLAGLALMVWALISIASQGPDAKVADGIGQLIVAIGGFFIVAAGAELRMAGTAQLRAVKCRGAGTSGE